VGGEQLGDPARRGGDDLGGREATVDDERAAVGADLRDGGHRHGGDEEARAVGERGARLVGGPQRADADHGVRRLRAQVLQRVAPARCGRGQLDGGDALLDRPLGDVQGLVGGRRADDGEDHRGGDGARGGLGKTGFLHDSKYAPAVR
jgi:hypothetical protein